MESTSLKMKYILILLVSVFLFPVLKVKAQDEFLGPFKSWANVKTRFGARGDGKSDDSKAIQAAIEGLANGESGLNTKSKAPYTVIYFPAGTYLISETLVLKGKIGIRIIGEDPKKTIIRWVGKSNDTMLLANGSATFEVSRFTWQANNRKGMEAVGVHWLTKWNDGKTRSYASLNIELSEMEFFGFAVGIGGGTFAGAGTGSNDSEITIRRCKFFNCTTAGINITGFNALDYWIWSCEFNNCQYGVYCANGNYHAYRCNFKGSTASDFYNRGGYYLSVRECYSYGSKSFSVDEGSSCNPFKRIFQKNTIVNTLSYPIEFYHLSNIALFDNKFPTVSDRKDSAEVLMAGWCPGVHSILSLNNQFTAADPIYMNTKQKKMIRYGDTKAVKIKRGEKMMPPVLPSYPVRMKRTVFDVPLGANAATIQQTINKAHALRGKKAIVHFPIGKFILESPLEIPANSDIQICGDGMLYSTQLLPSPEISKSGKPLIVINGPSNISITDIQIGLHIQDKPVAATLAFKGIDAKGSRFIMDQLYSSADTTLNLDGLNYLYVEKNNSFFTAGNFISGGDEQRRGRGTFRVNCSGGQFAQLTVKNNAEFIAKDCWWEGKQRIPVQLEGNGSVTLDGGMIAPIYVDSTPSIIIKKFAGKISIMNMYIQGGWSIEPGNDQLDFLGANLHFYYKTRPADIIDGPVKFRAMFTGLSSQCFDEKNEACKSIMSFMPSSKNVNNEQEFLRKMTNFARESGPLIATASRNDRPSSVYISRVSIGSAFSAIKVSNDR